MAALNNVENIEETTQQLENTIHYADSLHNYKRKSAKHRKIARQAEDYQRGMLENKQCTVPWSTRTAQRKHPN